MLLFWFGTKEAYCGHLQGVRRTKRLTDDEKELLLVKSRNETKY